MDRSREVERALRWLALKVDSRPSRACRAGRAGARHGEPRLRRPPEEPRRSVLRRRWGRPAAEEPTSPRPPTMTSSRPLCRKRQPMEEGEVGERSPGLTGEGAAAAPWGGLTGAGPRLWRGSGGERCVGGVTHCVWIGRGLIFFQGSSFITAILLLLLVPLQL